MKTFDILLDEAKNTKIKWKKSGAGSYSAQIKHIYIDLYKKETSDNQWGATIDIGTYGKDDYEESVILAGYSKKEVVGYCQAKVDKLLQDS